MERGFVVDYGQETSGRFIMHVHVSISIQYIKGSLETALKKPIRTEIFLTSIKRILQNFGR